MNDVCAHIDVCVDVSERGCGHVDVWVSECVQRSVCVCVRMTLVCGCLGGYVSMRECLCLDGGVSVSPELW